MKEFYDSAELKYKIYFKNDNRQDFSYKYYKNSNILYCRHYKNGLLDGICLRYNDKNELLYQYNYINNIRNGSYERHNDSITIKGEYLNGNKNNLEIYLKDGIIEKILNYKYGNLNGIQHINIISGYICCYKNNSKYLLGSMHNYNNCCICWEKTFFITKCNHNLCSSCLDKKQ